MLNPIKMFLTLIISLQNVSGGCHLTDETTYTQEMRALV